MNFLPVAHRELKQASRKPMTYYSRSLSALLAGSVCLALIYAAFSGDLAPAACGQTIFYSLSALAYLYVCIDGALLTSDSLSSEKREGTLGLLFLTDLKGYDIIAGKLVPYLSRSLYCLVAAFPASTLGFLFGGLSMSDYLLMMIALANALFFSSTLGLLEQRKKSHCL